MNDDYLWDRSGAPDEEVQKLEQALSPLRYQPRQLEIPNDLHVGRRPFAFRALSIAAAIALLLLVPMVWRNWQNSVSTTVATAPIQNPAIRNVDKEPVAVTAGAPVNSSVATATDQPSGSTSVRTHRVDFKASSHRTRRSSPVAAGLPASEIAEAKAAKEQLMFALRLTSAKLNLAQKQAQGAAPGNQIQNQHKIG